MPKAEIEDIRLGVSPLTGTVYASVMAKQGLSRLTWQHKQDVTPAFVRAMVGYLHAAGGQVELQVKGEKKHTITITDH